MPCLKSASVWFPPEPQGVVLIRSEIHKNRGPVHPVGFSRQVWKKYGQVVACSRKHRLSNWPIAWNDSNPVVKNLIGGIAYPANKYGRLIYAAAWRGEARACPTVVNKGRGRFRGCRSSVKTWNFFSVRYRFSRSVSFRKIFESLSDLSGTTG